MSLTLAQLETKLQNYKKTYKKYTIIFSSSQSHGGVIITATEQKVLDAIDGLIQKVEQEIRVKQAGKIISSELLQQHYLSNATLK